MKRIRFKFFETKGLKQYYITTYLVFALFLYSVFMYKEGYYLFGSEYASMLRIFLTIVFVTLTSLLIHEMEGGERSDSVTLFPKKPGMMRILGLNALSAIFFHFYFQWTDIVNLPETIVLGRLLLTGYTIFALFLSVGRSDSRRYGRHLWKTLSSIGIALFFSVVLYLGLSFLALMLNLLFELEQVDIYINDYIFLAILSFVLAFPLLFLSIYTNQKEEEAAETTRFEIDFISRISLFYIVMPLLIVYTVVLYIYFLKQVFILEFPNNVVAHLVIWFLFASHIALYFLSGITGYKNEFEKWVIRNSRTLVPALMIPVILLFVSIGIRIHYYGFTEARYFLLLFSVFHSVGLLLLYFFRWRAQFAIVVLSIVMLHIALYGSFSVSNVTYNSQMAMLERILAEKHIDLQDVVDGNISIEEIDEGMDREHEFCNRVSTAIDQVLNTGIPAKEGKEYRTLAGLRSHCNGYLYSTKYYAGNTLSSRNISAYNYNEILELSDTEHIFRIRKNEHVEVGSFVAVGNSGGISFFEREGLDLSRGDKDYDEERLPIYYFDFSANIIADEAREVLYEDEFEHDGVRYEVFLFVEDFNYNVSDEGKIVHEEYNYYNFQIIVRQKR